jgi:superfamily I DNA/RNA helicase
MIKLDDEQKYAVYADPDKSLLIKAPPGSGKTLVMAKRIEFLVKINAVNRPFKILGLTFSNVAADEMRKRVIKEVPIAKGLVYITNFHSFSYSILKAYGNHIGLKRDFLIISEMNSEQIIKQMIRKEFPKKPLKKIIERYNDWKIERLLKLNPDYTDGKYDSEFENVLSSYRAELKIQNKLDFDHILYYSYELLKNNESILNYYKSVFKYLLVDEFQDTNPLQFRLIELLVKKNSSRCFKTPIFILADPNQGIYEFQGADPKNMDLIFDSLDCELINLKNDYRFNSSGIKLLKDAIGIFIENKEFLIGPLPSKKPSYSIWKNKKDETNYLLREIERFKEEKVKLHEIAILSPTGANLRRLKRKLKKEEYVFIPDFKGPEIEKKYSKIFNELNNFSKSVGSLENTIRTICKIEKIDITDDIVSLLIEISRKFDKNYSEDLNEKIGLFLNEILLEINWGKFLREKIKNKIFLSTIHSAKGLEFEKVIVCGLENGSLPFFTSCNKCDGHLDEKEWIKSLKIFNVGISRAKDELCLSSSKRNNNGYKTHSSCVVNVFCYYIDFN